LIQKLPQDLIVLPLQTLGELFNVLVKKGGRSLEEARSSVLSWRDSYDVAETTAKVVIAATDLSSQHRLGILDSVILATDADVSCRLLLSEDMQDGFTSTGVTIGKSLRVNAAPIARKMAQCRASLLPDKYSQQFAM
jgi:predicted nucleic acid-binding protein